MAADPPTLAIARLSRVLENHTATDLSLSQYRVLGLLASGHERAGDLAARLAVTKPTLTALVDGLVDRGYVVREALPGDRRAVRVAITDGGRDAAEAAGRGFRAVLDEVLGYCADADAVLAAIDALRLALDARWADAASPATHHREPDTAAGDRPGRHPPRAGRTRGRLAAPARPVRRALPRRRHRHARALGHRPGAHRAAAADPAADPRRQHHQPGAAARADAGPAPADGRARLHAPTTCAATSAPRSACTSSTTCAWPSTATSTSSTSPATTSSRSATSCPARPAT